MTDKRYRLEGSTRSDEIETGLQIRIADVLWMLARQWQVGEFRGEDAASPVQARYQLQTTALAAFRPSQAEAFAAIDPSVPLEAYAEQQPLHKPAGFWRSVEAGIHLLQMLSDGGFGTLRGWLRQHYPPGLPPDAEPTEQARIQLLARRACDGERILQDRAQIAQTWSAQLTGDLQAAFQTIFDAWAAWYADRIFTPEGSGCWDSERMEYRFQVASGTEPDAVVLEANEYPGGHLDWFSFDKNGGDVPILRRELPRESRTVFPAPVRFAGMPAQRWWEFDDGTVNFGNFSNNPADFAGMITAAFATTYGDDWYVLPIRVPIGSLAKIESLDVLDSFGDVQRISSIATHDGPNRVWRYFELKGEQADPSLFVPAVALGKLEGKAVESVSLIRDETENLAWGVENRYEGVLEQPIERLRQWSVSRAQLPAAEPSDTWHYNLLNPVPPYWIPFIPVPTGKAGQIRLQRGRMAEWELLPPDLFGIKGTTLLPAPNRPLRIFEEEVPFGGVVIAHTYQFARHPGGQAYTWLGIRKQPAGKLTAIQRQTDEIVQQEP